MVLIGDEEINVPYGPGLIEVEFEMRIPQQLYPFARNYTPPEVYTQKLNDLKENKRPFQFIVSRYNVYTGALFDTNLTMLLEDYHMKEDAEEGFDVLYEVTLRQYKPFGTQMVSVRNDAGLGGPSQIPAQTETRPEPDNAGNLYVVKGGDTLMHIAANQLGDSSRWREIYDTNQSTIESTAIGRGIGGSSGGYWIFPGQELVIP
jgi:hypothetical protein